MCVQIYILSVKSISKKEAEKREIETEATSKKKKKKQWRFHFKTISNTFKAFTTTAASNSSNKKKNSFCFVVRLVFLELLLLHFPYCIDMLLTLPLLPLCCRCCCCCCCCHCCFSPLFLYAIKASYCCPFEKSLKMQIFSCTSFH